jgi:nicotinamide-nucleotide amidase
MADHTRQYSHTDLAIAITGIAGPDGGSVEKPVGTVWIAWSGNHCNTIVQHYVFTGDRQAIRLASMIKALEVLLTLISGSR